VSPEVGHLDEDALEQALDEDPDATLALLADLTGATDERLRALARVYAARLVVDLAKQGQQGRRGVGRLRVRKMNDAGGDLDVDASLDGLMEAKGQGRAPHLDELHSVQWHRPGTAWCLVVDRSGSMGGERVATAALAAAAVAYRNPADHSVIAFSGNVIVIKGQESTKPPAEVVENLFVLRGHGTTDLALALQVANEQLARSTAGRKLCVLLSDCRAVDMDAAISAATGLDELFVVAPADDAADARLFAGRVGARFAELGGPSDVPRVFARLV
jgi:Mg-chelatase subunit ChlD